jgi:hypothetical protein
MKLPFLLITALAVVLGCAFCATPASAQTNTMAAPATTTTTKKAKSAFTSYPKGSTITSISATSLVLNTSKGALTLTVDASTKFLVDKKKAAVTDFAAGDAVTGSYATNADGTLTAHSLHKKSAK